MNNETLWPNELPPTQEDWEQAFGRPNIVGLTYRLDDGGWYLDTRIRGKENKAQAVLYQLPEPDPQSCQILVPDSVVETYLKNRTVTSIDLACPLV